MAVAGAAVLSQPLAAQAGPPATTQGRTTAEIVVPLRITAESDLDFGCLVAHGDGEVAVSSADGSASYTGGVQSVGGAGCSHAPALFAVAGASGREYRYLVEPVAYASHSMFADERLLVRDLAGSSGHASASGSTGLLDPAGRDRLTVGGTLVVPEGARPGRYRARITVTVAYM